MGAWAFEHEAGLRLAIFLSALALLGLGEWLRPRRNVDGGWRRRATNLALVAVDTVVVRLVFPLVAVGVAFWAEQRGMGMLRLVAVPGWLAFVAGVLVLDVAIYWQHRILHMVPLLWRLHRVHHADLGFDLTTGVRFHPLEIVLSLLFKFALIVLFGIGPLAVLVFEVLLNLGALFTHSNLALPDGLDRRLRWLLVTPDMHRVHHSVHRDETDSNFGFHLSCWDRLFRSYRDQPRDGHTAMRIGLLQFRDGRAQRLWALLLNPFRG
jgi:sterol desaturase/sphingolipid hydroxylase (fatty acid hydroxylase superfamily)